MVDPKPVVPKNFNPFVESSPSTPSPSPKPTLKGATPKPRRAVLAYKAQRTAMDIESLKQHIGELEKELKITKAKIFEEEEKKGRIPKLVERVDLLGQGGGWEADDGKGVVGIWEGGYEVEEFSNESEQETEEMEGAEEAEVVYILDGGNTVISVQEIAKGI
jgi:hypothetical protein